MTVAAQLGSATVDLEEFMRLSPGDVLVLDRRLSEPLEMTLTLAWSLHLIGVVYYQASNFPEALEHCLRALQVYRATDTKLGREVAIKVLPEEVAGDAERLARFEREARAVAALSHPNVLAVHDFGTADGAAYLVTELLAGETLRERAVRPRYQYLVEVESGERAGDLVLQVVGVHVRVRRDEDPRRERCVPGPVHGLRRGHRHRLVGPAVEAALEHDNIRTPGCLPRQLDCTFYCFSS